MLTEQEKQAAKRDLVRLYNELNDPVWGHKYKSSIKL